MTALNPEASLNPYATPNATLDLPVSTSDRLLYVVAPRKLLIMLVATVGFYQVYWFYRNWAGLNTLHRAYWPIPRAIFAIFFTHALFREVEHLRVRRGHPWTWQPETLAWVFVGSILVPTVVNNVFLREQPVIALLLGWAFWIPLYWSLYQAQRAINAAEGDPDGQGNRALTGANVAWLVVGAALWLVQIGFLVILLNPELVTG